MDQKKYRTPWNTSNLTSLSLSEYTAEY
jgi:hypothetical protein